MSIETLHSEACTKLRTDEFLKKNNVLILQEDQGDLESAIRTQLSKLACCAVVGTPTARSQSGASSIIVAEASLNIQVFENAILNRGKANSCTAGEAARAIARGLNYTQLPSGEIPVFKELQSAAVNDQKAGTIVVWDVKFTAQTTI
jgi:hypothetical protein